MRDRQDPDYGASQSLEDALAIMTAMIETEGGNRDVAILEQALHDALEGTNHTELVYEIATVAWVAVRLAAHAAGVDPREYHRTVAQIALQLDAEDGEGQSGESDSQ